MNADYILIGNFLILYVIYYYNKTPTSVCYFLCVLVIYIQKSGYYYLFDSILYFLLNKYEGLKLLLK